MATSPVANMLSVFCWKPISNRQAQAGSGLFPAWLNEGLAEYVEALALGRRRLSAGQYRVLIEASQDGSWIPPLTHAVSGSVSSRRIKNVVPERGHPSTMPNSRCAGTFVKLIIDLHGIKHLHETA